MTVAALPDPREELAAKVATLLAELLAEAEEGRILSILVVAERPEGYTEHATESDASPYEQAGRLMALALRRLGAGE